MHTHTMQPLMVFLSVSSLASQTQTAYVLILKGNRNTLSPPPISIHEILFLNSHRILSAFLKGNILDKT